MVSFHPFLHPPGPRRPHHDDHLRPGRKGLLDALRSIGREDDDSLVTLDALEEMGRLRIRISIMGIVDPTACPEQRVCFIEKEDRVGVFGGGEDAVAPLASALSNTSFRFFSVSPMY